MIPSIFGNSVQIDFSRTMATNSESNQESEAGTESTRIYPEFPWTQSARIKTKFPVLPGSNRLELSSTEDCLITRLPSIPLNSLNIPTVIKKTKKNRKFLLVIMLSILTLSLVISLGILIVYHAKNLKLLKILDEKLNNRTMELSNTQKEKEELETLVNKIKNLLFWLVENAKWIKGSH